MAHRREQVEEVENHDFSTHPRGGSGLGDRYWRRRRRREGRKEQEEGSGKQKPASPLGKEREVPKN